MTRARNWQRAQRDSERAREYREKNRGRARPGERSSLAPTESQLAYIGRLASDLGREITPPQHRSGASALIQQLKQNLATAKRE